MPEQVEMPGGPQLDHYYGRGVEGVEVVEDGEESGWSIILSGNVRISNHDEQLVPPDELGGLSFLNGIFSELDTRLVFGISGPNANPDRNVEVRLTPTKYSINDPAIAGGEHYPQRPPELEPETDEEAPEGASEASEEVEGEETAEGDE